MYAPMFQIKKTIGDDYNVDLEDSLSTKQALERLGYYETPSYGMTPYPDRHMFDSMKAFQKDEGLQVDGLMRPGGPTEARIDQRLAQAEGKRKDTNTPVPMPSHQGDNQKDCNASGKGYEKMDDYTARDRDTGQLFKCKPRPWYDPRDNWEPMNQSDKYSLPKKRR